MAEVLRHASFLKLAFHLPCFSCFEEEPVKPQAVPWMTITMCCYGPRSSVKIMCMFPRCGIHWRMPFAIVLEVSREPPTKYSFCHGEQLSFGRHTASILNWVAAKIDSILLHSNSPCAAASYLLGPCLESDTLLFICIVSNIPH